MHHIRFHTLFTFQLGLIKHVFAGANEGCACVTDETSTFSSAVYELAASERFFHVTLTKMTETFLDPLLTVGGWNSCVPRVMCAVYTTVYQVDNRIVFLILH